MAEDPYVYPGTGVLRDSLEIRDLAEFAVAEADIVRTALAILAEKPLLGSYDLAHWQAFHRRIFGVLYLGRESCVPSRSPSPTLSTRVRSTIAGYARASSPSSAKSGIWSASTVKRSLTG